MRCATPLKTQLSYMDAFLCCPYNLERFMFAVMPFFRLHKEEKNEFKMTKISLNFWHYKMREMACWIKRGVL